MAADVLLYNALNDLNAGKRAQVAALDSQIAAKATECAGYESTIATNSVAIVNHAGPEHPELWGLIPTQPEAGGNFDSGFKVCDTSGYYRCGSSCTWTVPAGVTCARFQIWGSGAGTGSSCCCGWTHIGPSGAYASVIIPVTEGDTYTLCGGCAYCCYGTRGQVTVQGCPSYVTGTGLTNFCAEGGKAGMFCEMKVRCSMALICCNYCIYSAGSACICTTGTDVCIEGNQGGYTCSNSAGAVNIRKSCAMYYGSAASGTVYGIQGAYHLTSEGNGAVLCVRHAPVYGFPNDSCCHCCIATSGRAGLERSACAGYMQIPSAGGWAAFTCAGCATHCGDAGRMGMVCVSWKS